METVGGMLLPRWDDAVVRWILAGIYVQDGGKVGCELSDSDPGEVNLKELAGIPVKSVGQVTGRSGDTVELHITLNTGIMISFTVWTDWSLRVEVRRDSGIPGYLWPASDYAVQALFPDDSIGSITIVRVEEIFDEVGALSGVDIEFDKGAVELRSYGGELLVSHV